MLTVGSLIAGYRIERILGSGGMGTVYLARDPDLPRSDALKILSPELSRDADFRARFQREADVASMLDHPNIVAIRRRGEFDGQLWIAMQFIDGTDADAALYAGAMTPARAVHIVREVGKALDYAHDHNVVHRDIKPANFLLSRPTTGDERVLLADFGIARAVDATGGLTSAGVVLATVSYAAPEVLLGHPFDGRADLYSLGCSLFRMLTGKTPFPANNGMAAVMMAHLMQPAPRVTDLNPHLPAQVDHVIVRAMAKDPAQRFQSARELAEAAAVALDDSTMPIGVPRRAVPSGEVSSYPTSTPAVNAPPWWQGAPRHQMSLARGPSHYLAPAFPTLASPPVKSHQRGRRVGALAVVVAVVAVLAIAIAVNRPSPNVTATTTSSATASPITPPAVPASLLNGLLLSADETNTITSGPDMWPGAVSDKLFGDSANMSDKDCVGAWLPAEAGVYTGTSWDGVAAQKLRPPDVDIWQQGVVQAVVGFSTIASAEKFLADQTNTWKACSGRAFTVTPPNVSPQHWTFGNAGVVDGTTGIPLTMAGGGACQRSLAVRRNVTIDVLVCGNDTNNLAGAIVGKIAAKIGQR
jgi:serine/threonine-protein kinase